MIDRIHAVFSELFAGLHPPPVSALEVGALPSWKCLLATTQLQDVPQRVGVNLNVEGTFDGVHILKADGRKLPFDDCAFDLVVSNSMLEHIPDFWLAVREMHRVLSPGGVLAIGVPGYDESRRGNRLREMAFRLPAAPDLLKRGTVTMRVHDARDYYRFSRHTFEDVLLSGLDEVQIRTIMLPPRLVGSGRRPAP
jgi:SAM-dependent methyltransferase